LNPILDVDLLKINRGLKRKWSPVFVINGQLVIMLVYVGCLEHVRHVLISCHRYTQTDYCFIANLVLQGYLLWLTLNTNCSEYVTHSKYQDY